LDQQGKAIQNEHLQCLKNLETEKNQITSLNNQLKEHQNTNNTQVTTINQQLIQCENNHQNSVAEMNKILEANKGLE